MASTSSKRPHADDALFSESFKLPRLEGPTSGARVRPSLFDTAPHGPPPIPPLVARARSPPNTSIRSITPGPREAHIDDSRSDSGSLHPVLDLSRILHPYTEPSPVTLSPSTLFERFADIARLLLHKYHLCISGPTRKSGGDEEITRFELLEVEFYLRAPGHVDPFAHGTDEQRESGKWYFHRAPRRSKDASRSATSTGWRGGTRKGFDLTFGGPVSSSTTLPSKLLPSSNEEDVRGGILIRALLPSSGGPALVGPSLCVDAILAAAGASSIKELVLEMWEGNTSALSGMGGRKGAIWLEPRSSSASSALPSPTRGDKTPVMEAIFTGPRIGLDLSHPGTQALASDPRVRFVAAPLRFFRHPELLTRVGRAHTVIAVLRALCPGPLPILVHEREELIERIAAKTALGGSAVQKYIDAFEQGFAEGGKGGESALKKWIGERGKGVGAKMDVYARMCGCLAGVGVELHDI